MAIDRERLMVIDNIKNAIIENNLNKKVELNDPKVTEKMRRDVIIDFDILKKKLSSKFNTFFANFFYNKETKARNKYTEIIGIENLKDIKTGAIITCNHFNPVDCTVIKYMIKKIGKKNKFNIIVQEPNMFMDGKLGWMIKNCNTIPLSDSHEFMSKNFIPSLKKLLNKKRFVLIYPEQEMWYNYKKPRTLKSGAYRFACMTDVPIIPCFIEMKDLDEKDNDGFYKIKHILHIMPPLYKDNNLTERENTKNLKELDYILKVNAYEKAYNKHLDYTFDEKNDIAGFNK